MIKVGQRRKWKEESRRIFTVISVGEGGHRAQYRYQAEGMLYSLSTDYISNRSFLIVPIDKIWAALNE